MTKRVIILSLAVTAVAALAIIVMQLLPALAIWYVVTHYFTGV